jgi:hypothetical protein
MNSADKANVSVSLKMSPKLITAIDNFRRVQPQIVSRSEVIKMFVSKWLETELADRASA